MERLVISRFAGLLDTRFQVIGFRDLKGLSDYRDKERRRTLSLPFSFFLPSQILSDTRRNDGSVSWPADKCSEKTGRAMAKRFSFLRGRDKAPPVTEVLGKRLFLEKDSFLIRVLMYFVRFFFKGAKVYWSVIFVLRLFIFI